MKRYTRGRGQYKEISYPTIENKVTASSNVTHNESILEGTKKKGAKTEYKAHYPPSEV